MPAPFGPDDPDPLPALGGKERGAGDDLGVGGRRTIGCHRASPGKVADSEVVDAHDDLAAARRPRATDQGRSRDRQLAPRLGGVASLGLQLFEPGLVLVLLAELAVTPVALDQLLLAGDLLGLGVDVLDHPRVAFHALPVVGAVVAAERRQLPVAQLPDAVDRGVEEGTVVRRDEQRTRPATKVLLEPFEGVEVEVIGRFVEEEQVRIRDDQPGKRCPRLLAA